VITFVSFGKFDFLDAFDLTKKFKNGTRRLGSFNSGKVKEMSRTSAEGVLKKIKLRVDAKWRIRLNGEIRKVVLQVGQDTLSLSY
jgi:hypothetical protein